MARLRGALGSGAEDPAWDDVEETLIAGDVGAALAIDIVELRPVPAGPGRRSGVGPHRAGIATRRARPRLGAASPRSRAVRRSCSSSGVNGTGKTTTIGKLASRYARTARP